MTKNDIITYIMSQDEPNINLLSTMLVAGDLDTSDATATAADIALGKTAYVNGVKITGTYEASAE